MYYIEVDWGSGWQKATEDMKPLVYTEEQEALKKANEFAVLISDWKFRVIQVVIVAEFN